jgi:hypothetical protein
MFCLAAMFINFNARKGAESAKNSFRVHPRHNPFCPCLAGRQARSIKPLNQLE